MFSSFYFIFVPNDVLKAGFNCTGLPAQKRVIFSKYVSHLSPYGQIEPSSNLKISPAFSKNASFDLSLSDVKEFMRWYIPSKTRNDRSSPGLQFFSFVSPLLQRTTFFWNLFGLTLETFQVSASLPLHDVI